MPRASASVIVLLGKAFARCDVRISVPRPDALCQPWQWNPPPLGAVISLSGARPWPEANQDRKRSTVPVTGTVHETLTLAGLFVLIGIRNVIRHPKACCLTASGASRRFRS